MSLYSYAAAESKAVLASLADNNNTQRRSSDDDTEESSKKQTTTECDYEKVDWKRPTIVVPPPFPKEENDESDQFSIRTSEIATPPPLRPGRNISQPGAFRVSVRPSQTLALSSERGSQAMMENLYDDASVENRSLEFSPSPRVRSRMIEASPHGNNDTFRDEGEQQQQGDILVVATLVADDLEIPSESGQQRVVAQNNGVPSENKPFMITSEEITAEMMSEIMQIDLVQARPVWNRKAKCYFVLLIMLLLALLGLIVGVAVGMNVSVWYESTNSSLVSLYSPEPTVVLPPPLPTMAPTPPDDNFFEDILPENIQLAITEDPQSPQAKAYSWLQNDDEPEKYSNDRKLQRFVLALLYFSLFGDAFWTRPWLMHNFHECDWYTDEMTSSICDDDDEYEILHLISMNITGGIPNEISLLPALTKIDFSDNAFTGTIPSEISRLSNLRQLDFYQNLLTGSIPSELGQLTELTYIDLDRNALDQSIPTEFARLSNLRIASFVDNYLSGSLPGELFTDWGRLSYLSLEGNHLVGTLPMQIGLLSSLTIVDLSNNGFHGPIPTQFGNLSALKHLFLENNDFSGTVPWELGLLTDLERLWLYGNNLWGSIPHELCQLLLVGSLEQLVVNCAYVACDCGCMCHNAD